MDGSVRIAPMIRLKLFYLPPSGLPRQPPSIKPWRSKMRAPFFVYAEPAIFSCLYHVGPCGLLAVACPPAMRYPQKRKSL
jgi:hypothetical protein